MIYSTIELSLYTRINELEDVLEKIRSECAFNLSNPGNEDDTFQQVIDRVTHVLHDGYEYEEMLSEDA